MKISILLLSLFMTSLLKGQVEYIGGGQNIDKITVTASSTTDNTSPQATINGSGLDAAIMEATRFLYQAGFGASRAEATALVTDNNNFEQWIDAQMAIAPTLMLPTVLRINDETYQLYINRKDEDGNPLDPEDYFGPAYQHFSYAWWDNIKKAPDQLRYKVAHALSQILVISMESELLSWGDAVGDYYDIFLRHAFGNYKDILTEVSLHPTMGYYLSHLNNRKANPRRNRQPDENYARELMQLFTIGLYQLNTDGSYKLGADGQPIPTYDNTDIKELAKVFTGLGGADLNPEIKEEYPDYEIEFGANIYAIDRLQPMIMYERQHQKGEKTIVGGYTIPDGQGGMKDIEDAIDHLFNHPNVGPFICRQLIQRMVTSNPSAAYIQRVAEKFNNNGKGVRGDLSAVIKAILLDEEARSCNALSEGEHGKLREPTLRNTHLLRALPMDSPLNDYWMDPLSNAITMKQAPMSSPTVFNFYLPDYQPPGEIAAKGLVAPEFQILDSETSIGYVNKTVEWTLWGFIMYDWEDDDTPPVRPIYDQLEQLSQDPEALIRELDILLCHGQMTEATKSTIRSVLEDLPYPNDNLWRARFATFITMISPDYVIIK